MSFALVINATITAIQGALPDTAAILDANGEPTDNIVLGFPTTDTATQQACGWYQVVDTPQPTPAAGDTLDRSVQLVSGVPTVVWTERPMTADELAAQTAGTNQSAIITNLASDLVNMQTIIDTANATINSSPAASMKNIARMLRRLGRLASNDLSGSS